MKTCCKVLLSMLGFLALDSCEILDDDPDRHASGTPLELEVVAEMLASIPLQAEHIDEVFQAARASSDNGYDEEYTMRNLFEAPGSGVGTGGVESKAADYGYPLRNLIADYLHQRQATRAAGGLPCSPEEYMEALSSSDIQIYWPFSECWDGETMPIITFDPEDGAEVNVGYRLFQEDDGSRHVEEVIVDEEMAEKVPVWVVNRNSDAGYTSLEMLRREDPAWGEGGGSIIVKPDTKASRPLKTLILKEFTMNRNYDSWFAGASEFFIKVGSLDDFTASTEAELRLFNPMVTDFMVVVRRSQLGRPQTINTILVPDWNPQMTHCAFMITEDDGGTRTEWKCTALVRIASKSYGVEINLPFNSRDDVVWRGHLTSRWLEANSNLVGHFGDVALTFEVMEY